MLNNVKLAPISAFCNGLVFLSSCLFFVKVGMTGEEVEAVWLGSEKQKRTTG